MAASRPSFSVVIDQCVDCRHPHARIGIVLERVEQGAIAHRRWTPCRRRLPMPPSARPRWDRAAWRRAAPGGCWDCRRATAGRRACRGGCPDCHNSLRHRPAPAESCGSSSEPSSVTRRSASMVMLHAAGLRIGGDAADAADPHVLEIGIGHGGGVDARRARR